LCRPIASYRRSVGGRSSVNGRDSMGGRSGVDRGHHVGGGNVDRGVEDMRRLDHNDGRSLVRGWHDNVAARWDMCRLGISNDASRRGDSNVHRLSNNGLMATTANRSGTAYDSDGADLGTDLSPDNVVVADIGDGDDLVNDAIPDLGTCDSNCDGDCDNGLLDVDLGDNPVADLGADHRYRDNLFLHVHLGDNTGDRNGNNLPLDIDLGDHPGDRHGDNLALHVHLGNDSGDGKRHDLLLNVDLGHNPRNRHRHNLLLHIDLGDDAGDGDRDELALDVNLGDDSRNHVLLNIDLGDNLLADLGPGDGHCDELLLDHDAGHHLALHIDLGDNVLLGYRDMDCSGNVDR